ARGRQGIPPRRRGCVASDPPRRTRYRARQCDTGAHVGKRTDRQRADRQRRDRAHNAREVTARGECTGYALRMRRLSVVAALTVASSCGGAASNGPRARMTAKDIVQRSSPAIVRIEAGSEKVGTGFIVDKSGIVATNLHVVAGESAIKVRLYDGTQYPVMQIAGVDPDRDLALLQIRPTKDLPI